MAELSRILLSIDDGAHHLTPADYFHQQSAGVLQEDICQLESVRWTVIQITSSKFSPVFNSILVSCLLIAFCVFGVASPRNTLVFITLFVSAFSVATCLDLILKTSIRCWAASYRCPVRRSGDALWHVSQVN